METWAKITPCRDCKKRKVGCHGTCKEYKEFRKEVIVNKVNHNKNKPVVYKEWWRK